MKRSILFFGLSLLLIIAAFVAPVAAQDRPDLLIWADHTRTPALTDLAAQFSEANGVKVEVQEIGMGDIRANLGVVGPTGQGPDIIIAAHDWIGELVLNGSVIPFDLGDKADLFVPSALNLFTYNGQLYGMPYAVENVGFFRNTDLVPDAPATWDDVRSISEDLVSSGKSKYGWIIQTADAYHWFPQLSAFGGYFFGRDDQGNYNPEDVGVDSDGAIAGAQFLEGMAKDGYIPTAVDYDVMHSLFETGDAAMIITGPWALTRLRDAGVPYAISDIPAGPAGAGKPLIGGQGFMISAYSENQLLAESFLLDFMATDDAMKAMYDADPRPPALKTLLDSLDDPDFAALQHAGQVGVPQPSIPQMSSVWGAVQNAQQFIIQGDVPADEAMKTAADQIRTLIAGGTITTTVATTVGDTPPEGGPQAVSIPGTLQSKAGCASDWAPDCDKTQLAYNANSDVWMGTFVLPAGDYEYKAAINNGWDENYGANAAAGGDNIPLTVAADNTPVTFVFDDKTHWVMDNVNSLLAVAPGDFQSELGCSGDWTPDCLRSMLEDPDGDGVYTFTTDALPAGDYQVKVALNLNWDTNYGADGAAGGDNIAFNVPADSTPVTFSFDSASHVLTVSTGS